MAELISVIVTTYNREDALGGGAALACAPERPGFRGGGGRRRLRAGDRRDWSTPGRTRSGSRLEHVWHEDRGFRAAEIRNRAILAARGDLLHLPRRRLHRAAGFRRHPSPPGRAGLVRHRQPRPVVAANSPRKCCARSSAPERWSLARWLAQRLRGGINRVSALLRLPLGPLRRLRQKAWRGRALLQSRGLATRSRPRRRLRCRLQRLGQGGFRHHRAAAARGRAAQGRQSSPPA